MFTKSVNLIPVIQEKKVGRQWKRIVVAEVDTHTQAMTIAQSLCKPNQFVNGTSPQAVYILDTRRNIL